MQLKRKYIDWAVTGTLVVLLLIPATRVEILGFIQKGLLMTGLMDADTEETVPARADARETYQLPLQTPSGEEFHPRTLAGKVVFINFWATWCPPCVAEMPDIHELYQQLDSERYAFVMIALDNNPEKAAAFVERKGYEFPVYVPAGRFPPVYAHEAIPTTFVLSPTGEIAFRHEGMASYNTESFRTFLDSLAQGAAKARN